MDMDGRGKAGCDLIVISGKTQTLFVEMNIFLINQQKEKTDSNDETRS
jgi:hypothetical protein